MRGLFRFAIAGVVALAHPGAAAAQAHVHAAPGTAPAQDVRLRLMLGGPHLILHHRGFLALSEAQIAGLARLRRAVCDAELAYVERTTEWRDRLRDVLGDTVPLARTRLNEAMNGLAAAESDWIAELVRARREALALLTAPQRVEADALRDHWERETVAMIEEATRPGQRGHPGMQIPVRVPGMVVGETSLLPYCPRVELSP